MTDKTNAELADEIERSMSIMWALSPDRDAQREQDRVTGLLMVKRSEQIIAALRRQPSSDKVLKDEGKDE